MDRRSVLRWLGLVPVAAPVAVAAVVRVACDPVLSRTAPVLREAQARAAADAMVTARIESATARILAAEERISQASVTFDGEALVVPSLRAPSLPTPA